ncbi:MAG: hypothetical protein AB7F88_16040 [Pyrinomonadaceae bacterium]
MKQLTIRLKGEIQSSNFAEWKNDLIAQIQSVNTELSTDDDFVEAIRHVKLFREAEKYLKSAKQSAIDQASDIQRLFAAIDEISEKARQARLSLQRQINVRKTEVKEGCIQSGIDDVRSFINRQNSDFQLVDHGGYLDHNRFQSAAKGKGGVKGIQSAIHNLCDEIKREIAQKANEASTNGVTIDTVPNRYKLLFQDRNSLISLNNRELGLIIEKRIALFNEETAKLEAKKALEPVEDLEDVGLSTDTVSHAEKSGVLEKQQFRLIIEILSSENTAIEIARAIRQTYSENASISNIRLNRVHD